MIAAQSLYPWLVEPPKRAPRPMMTEIAALVAERHGLTVEDLRGPARPRRIAWPRQEAMALIYNMGGRSYPQVGRFFNCHHTTVIHAVKAHGKRLAGAKAEKELDSTFLARAAQLEARSMA